MKTDAHQEIIEKKETSQVGQGHVLEILEIKTEIRFHAVANTRLQELKLPGKATFQEEWSGNSKPD